MASEAQTDRTQGARRDGDGSAPRRPAAVTPAPSDRVPVDRLAHPDQPVPVSRNFGGVTLVGPAPQSSVTSADTSATTRTTAGLARRMPSCREMCGWA